MTETVPHHGIADHSRTGWGYVYFLRVADEIKIGFSTQPMQRTRVLKSAAQTETTEVLAIVPHTIIDEPTAHKKFAHLRVHHEYFRPAPDLLEFIEEVKAQNEKLLRPKKRAPLSPELQEYRKALFRLRQQHKDNEPVRVRINILLSNIDALQNPDDEAHLERLRSGMASTAQSLERIKADGWRYVPANHMPKRS